MGLPGGSGGKESTCNAETWVQSLGWEDPLEMGILCCCLVTKSCLTLLRPHLAVARQAPLNILLIYSFVC